LSQTQADTAGARLLVITGGSRGIGRAIAIEAAHAGWQVVVGARSPLPFDEAEAAGGSIHAFELDVCDPSSQTSFFARVHRELGCPNALVNSAGIDLGAIAIEDLAHADVQSMFAVNAVGLIESCHQFVRLAARSRGGQGGTIVNISSMASTIGGRRHKTVYAATKAAVDAFTVGAAKELAGEGIRVFSVRPGVTRTDMTAELLSDAQRRNAIRATIACGREAEVGQIAAPVIELLSERFAYASGSMINLAGGGFIL
jgi:NAD(P)-dependent dehydrogenase (short-subunit alcohol dehydrogenase family)